MMPVRIQRKRTKGWRMPENTVYVGRPTYWGNPFRAEDILDAYDGDKQAAWADCVRSYRAIVLREVPGYDVPTVEVIQRALRGKNLACFCRLDQNCHADVLLELANQ